MLTQSEADALIVMPKKRADREVYNFPRGGKTLKIPIVSKDGRESFLLDVYKGRIRLTKCTFQERYQDVFILVRLDVGGSPHPNPEVASVPIPHLDPYNGLEIQCPHLHIYVEGFSDKWAIPAPTDRFPRTSDLGGTLDDFFSYCNIVEPPTITGGVIDMLKYCSDLVNEYVEWLGHKITIEDINGTCEITTPFLDRHNDRLQIYVKRSDNGLVLTDDGYTITDLRLSGCEFTTEKRRQVLYSILNGFGVQLNEDELFVNARPDNFPQKKHNLIQAMLSINDLFVLARPMVASFFKEDVERYLRLHEIRYTPSVNFIGRSGFTHFFDFVIPASRAKPERILKAVNRPNRQNITSLIFSWDDTKGVRASDSTAYGVLNDVEHSINPDLVSALRQYDLKALLWSQRDKYINELAA